MKHPSFSLKALPWSSHVFAMSPSDIEPLDSPSPQDIVGLSPVMSVLREIPVSVSYLTIKGGAHMCDKRVGKHLSKGSRGFSLGILAAGVLAFAPTAICACLHMLY